MNQKKDLFAFAFSVAFLPPFWAVVSPYVGVSTGAVTLICAGVFAAGGSNPKDALKTSLSFLTGDVWAVLSLWLQQKLPLPANLGLYTIFFALGGVAVLVCGALPRIFHTPFVACRVGYWRHHHSLIRRNGYTPCADWGCDARGCILCRSGLRCAAKPSAGQEKGRHARRHF